MFEVSEVSCKKWQRCRMLAVEFRHEQISEFDCWTHKWLGGTSHKWTWSIVFVCICKTSISYFANDWGKETQINLIYRFCVHLPDFRCILRHWLGQGDTNKYDLSILCAFARLPLHISDDWGKGTQINTIYRFCVLLPVFPCIFQKCLEQRNTNKYDLSILCAIARLPLHISEMIGATRHK